MLQNSENERNKRSPGLYLMGDLADVFDLEFRMPRSLETEKRQVFKMTFSLKLDKISRETYKPVYCGNKQVSW